MKLHNFLDFFPSESGLADRQKGLAFGWLVAALGGVAAVIGNPKDAQATCHYCTGNTCTTDPCENVCYWEYHNPQCGGGLPEYTCTCP